MASGLILVVEDNPITRKMLRFALESEGFHVLEAGDGETALRLARERPPVLVLQDYVLPDMDGLALIEALRALPECSGMPILVVTGMVSQLDELRARAGALTTFLPKPIEPSRLIEVVRGLLAAPEEIGHGRRVLVVDDEPLNRKLASLRLQAAGFHVETASGGEEALGKARASPPDVIVSDVLMPGMDGFLFCSAVRRDARLAHIPVLLVSASYADEEDRRLAREMGASDLLLRIDDAQDIARALEASLQAGRPPAASPRDDVTALHERRLEAQIEKQMARNGAMLRQAAIQAAALSVVRGLAAALARPFELPSVLADVLVHCLDAAGLSTGLLYLVVGDGRLRLQAQAGLPAAAQAAAAEAFGLVEVLRGIMERGEPVAHGPSGNEPAEPGVRELQARLGHGSALFVPFVVERERLGVLVLAATEQDLSEPAWTSFARALATQFAHTIAVANSLSRGAVSETRYRSLMEHANDAILLLDTQYRILEANNRSEELLGRRRDEIVGHRWEDFVFPDERDNVVARRAELMTSGTVRVPERHLIRGDGARVPAEVSASLVRVGDEAVALFILRDISERQRSERELRAVQERLQHVVASSPAVLYTLRVDGRRLLASWVSANIEDAIGYSPSEVMGDQWWKDRLHPEDRDRVMAQVAELLATGHVRREYRFRSPDGSYRWIRDEQKLLRDAAGNPVEVVGSWWDIGDRKQAELRIEESEQKYRLLFEDNPHPMFVYDVDTLGFLAVNDAAVSEYGYSEAEFLAMTARDIRPPEDVADFLALLNSRRGEEMATQSRARHRRKDGTVVEVEVASNPIAFQGRSARLVLATDVTEKRKLEAQLAQAQKMEAVGRLAGGVAHDFNNLLGIITGYAELLLKDLGASHPGSRRAEEIRKAAERAAGLTRQLLAFSRKQVLEPRPLDLNVVVSDVDRMLRRLIGEDVQLVTVLGTELGIVRADPGQVEQVILNLAVNARDAMPLGGKLILETADVVLEATYSRIHGVPAGAYVMLAVSDTGHGMDGETLSHIFEPFFTTKGEGRGTGLGLSTVFGIVTQSGGHIGVYSEVGRGTTFKVYLPRVDGGERPQQARSVVPGPGPGGAETILLVEDAEALGLMVREILEDAGYQVVYVGRPGEALEAARSHGGPIHLLLTDVVMPGMSGREVAVQVAAAWPGVRVLFMSGYTDEAIGHHGVVDPGTHFIQKPFTADALLRKLRAILDAG